MMISKHKTLGGMFAALVLTAGAVNAAPVALTWTDTLDNYGGGIPGTIGEVITTTITVDNGGASLLSQTWGGADFVSYRIAGASGWWAQSTAISFSSGSFATNGAGSVTSAGTWYQLTDAALDTSWSGATVGVWFNNGVNAVACSRNPNNCIFATNVGDNQIGGNWTASLAAADVPLPGALPLLLASLGGLAVAARRRKAA